jgi:hypothetical protein
MGFYSRIPVAELDTEAFDNVEPGLACKPAAIYGEREGIALVCMYCPSKPEAHRYCERVGQPMSHGVCQSEACQATHRSYFPI